MNAGSRRDKGERNRQKSRDCYCRKHQQGGNCSHWQGSQPAQRQSHACEWRQDGTTQVVKHFPAPDSGDRARLRAEHPTEQLPVAAGPAMLALDGDIITRWKFLNDLDIGCQAGARENTFKEIVTQQGVFRDATVKRGLESIDIVNPLAGVRALAEQILINIGDRRRVGIHPAGPGKYQLIQ